jgi:hypothetical protein
VLRLKRDQRDAAGPAAVEYPGVGASLSNAACPIRAGEYGGGASP